MSVGLVVVSHSERIAEGVVELAAQMAGGVRIVAAGGTDDGGIGTSFDRVSRGLDEADSGDGVVVLCDLGSAVLTAETALDLADDAARDRIRIADAPIVEGAVAAAVAAETGGDVTAVLAAAEAARGSGTGPSDAAAPEPPSAKSADGVAERTVVLVNRSGLHARPAAEFVKAVSAFESRITVNGRDARSLLGVMSLGLTRGSEVALRAEGSDAVSAIDALADLVASGFGED